MKYHDIADRKEGYTHCMHVTFDRPFTDTSAIDNAENAHELQAEYHKRQRLYETITKTLCFTGIQLGTHVFEWIDESEVKVFYNTRDDEWTENDIYYMLISSMVEYLCYRDYLAPVQEFARYFAASPRVVQKCLDMVFDQNKAMDKELRGVDSDFVEALIVRLSRKL